MVKDKGFSLVELMIAMTIMAGVLGGVMTLASQMQQAYTQQQDANASEQEARYAVDWIARIIRSAGSNPYSVATACNGDAYQAIRVDPDGDGLDNDIRIQADIDPSDNKIVGSGGNCNEPNEDVTIAFDSATNTITRFDRGRDGAAVTMTESIITDLTFQYMKSDHTTATSDPDLIAYVTVTVTARSQGVGGRSVAAGIDASNYVTSRVSEEVRVRTRG